MRVLLVEDDESLGEIVKYNLEKEGFEVVWTLDGESALRELEKGHFDIVILDIMLPKISGVEVCRKIRESERTKELPVIMLTALSDEATKIKSFSYGADDYITKPFSMKELIARIGAISRRMGKSVGQVIEFDGLRLDKVSRTVSVNGTPIHLTKTEYQLLEFFLENPNRVFSREEILERVWGADHSESSRTLDVYISRLRKKLKEKGRYLKTLSRLGYKFSTEE